MLRTTSQGTTRIFRPLLIAATTAAMIIAAVALAGTAGVGAQEGQMSVDCAGGTTAVDTDCQYGENQGFTVTIHAVDAPAAGYPAFQAKLRWDPDVLDYRPTGDAAEEGVWPVCNIPGRFDNRPDDSSVLLGCSTFPVEESNYMGVLMRLQFGCVAAGTSQLKLIAREGDGQGGSHFITLDANEDQIVIDPVLMEATVTCGGGAVDTPEPDATNTPDPDRPDDPLATAVAVETETASELPVTGFSGGGDSGGSSLIAWLLLAAAVAVGAGGVGIFARQRIARQ